MDLQACVPQGMKSLDLVHEIFSLLFVFFEFAFKVGKMHFKRFSDNFIHQAIVFSIGSHIGTKPMFRVKGTSFILARFRVFIVHESFKVLKGKESVSGL